MGKSLSITVYPSATGAEYLTVSDAMRQVLDFIETLERNDSPDSESRQIVWRLTEAHTNSPPFTVTAQAYPVAPSISVGLLAEQLTTSFNNNLIDLLAGQISSLARGAQTAPLKRALQRNLNGIGRTEIKIEDREPINIVPSNATTAILLLERVALDESPPDQSRTEYGSVEVEIQGLTTWYEKPALQVIERLSRAEVTCVLNKNLAELIGPSHNWKEVWTGQRLLLTGALHYGSDGSLKKIDAESADEMPWTDVPLNSLQSIDILEGRSFQDFMEIIRGPNQ